MKKLIRKWIAILSGIASTLLIIVIGWVGGHMWIGTLAENLSSEETRVITKGWNYDSGEIVNFYFWYILLLCISFGMSITFLIWEHKSKFSKRLYIYIALLIPIIAFSGYNYFHFDIIMRPDMQVLFNFILIFLSIIVVIEFWKTQPKEIDSLVLKYIILTILITFGFILPVFFSTHWMLAELGIIDANSFLNITLITAIAGLISTSITVKKYFDERKKENQHRNISKTDGN